MRKEDGGRGAAPRNDAARGAEEDRRVREEREENERRREEESALKHARDTEERVRLAWESIPTYAASRELYMMWVAAMAAELMVQSRIRERRRAWRARSQLPPASTTSTGPTNEVENEIGVVAARDDSVRDAGEIEDVARAHGERKEKANDEKQSQEARDGKQRDRLASKNTTTSADANRRYSIWVAATAAEKVFQFRVRQRRKEWDERHCPPPTHPTATRSAARSDSASPATPYKGFGCWLAARRVGKRRREMGNVNTTTEATRLGLRSVDVQKATLQSPPATPKSGLRSHSAGVFRFRRALSCM